MKRPELFAMAAVAALLAAGCQSSVRVSGRATRPFEHPPVRYDGSLWRETLWEGTNSLRPENRRHTVSAVRVRTNYLYSLATVLSLGLWAPVDVEWEENDD